MQIVIDIPDKTANAIKDNVMFGVIPSEILWDITSAIVNGTPLDKIRAEISSLDDADYDYEGYYKAVTDAVKIIDKYKVESEDI